jgi:hypothetical protein
MSKGGSRWGAGRPGWHVKAEDCRQLDVREWQRFRCLEPSACGTWYFGDRASVDYCVGADAVVLRHDLAGRPMEQRLPITRTACHYGGERPWFACPICSKRVAVLYFRGRTGFACRRCSEVAYASQREDEVTRSWRRQGKIERRLGVGHTRPDSMRQTSYAALLRQITDCEQRRADPRKHVLLQAAQPLLRMGRAPSVRLRRVQLARHCLERGGAAGCLRELVCLPCLHGVSATLPCLACLIACRPCCLQAHFWVAAQRKA